MEFFSSLLEIDFKSGAEEPETFEGGPFTWEQNNLPFSGNLNLAHRKVVGILLTRQKCKPRRA
jgi:hypothetical protein